MLHHPPPRPDEGASVSGAAGNQHPRAWGWSCSPPSPAPLQGGRAAPGGGPPVRAAPRGSTVLPQPPQAMRYPDLPSWEEDGSLSMSGPADGSRQPPSGRAERPASDTPTRALASAAAQSA